MSLVELRERLALQKRMHLDEIKSKKEENKLRMQERADELVNKAQILQDFKKIKIDLEILKN